MINNINLLHRKTNYNSNRQKNSEKKDSNKNKINFNINESLITENKPKNPNYESADNKNSYTLFTKNYKSSPKINFKIKKVVLPQNIKDHKNSKDSLSNKTMEENSMIFPFQICYVCDSLNQRDFVYSTELCDHTLCLKCLKAFYEIKIENCDYTFKCPIFFCIHKYREELIKVFVSEIHYKSYLKKIGIKILRKFIKKFRNIKAK